MHHPTDRIAHTTAFVTPVVEHWLEREIERERETSAIMYTKNKNHSFIVVDFLRFAVSLRAIPPNIVPLNYVTHIVHTNCRLTRS